MSVNIRILIAEFVLLGIYLAFLGVSNTLPGWFTEGQKSILNIVATFTTFSLMAYMISRT